MPNARGFESWLGLREGGFHHLSKTGVGNCTYDLWNGTRSGGARMVRWGELGPSVNSSGRGSSPHTPKALLDPTYHATDLFTDVAIDVVEQHRVRIGEHKDQPLFLMLSYTAPHDPLMAPQKVRTRAVLELREKLLCVYLSNRPSCICGTR